MRIEEELDQIPLMFPGGSGLFCFTELEQVDTHDTKVRWIVLVATPASLALKEWERMGKEVSKWATVNWSKVMIDVKVELAGEGAEEAKLNEWELRVPDGPEYDDKHGVYPRAGSMDGVRAVLARGDSSSGND
jgi:hypothetical protein